MKSLFREKKMTEQFVIKIIYLLLNPENTVKEMVLYAILQDEIQYLSTFWEVYH